MKMNTKTRFMTQLGAATIATMLATTAANAQVATVGGTDIASNPVASADAGTGDTFGIENVVTATGTYDGDQYKNDAFENVDVESADPKLTINKVATLGDATTAIPAAGVGVGDEIWYTYTVTNTGNVILDNVVLSDNHVTAAGANALAVGTCTIKTDNTITAADSSTLNQNDTIINGGGTTITTFGPADVVECLAKYTVTQADVDDLQIVTP